MTRREIQWRRILSTSLLDATVPSDDVSSKSDCENRANRKVNRLLETGFVVLGLATSQNEEMKQVRGVDQTPYPSQLHGASLATAMQRPCRPLHEKENHEP